MTPRDHIRELYRRHALAYRYVRYALDADPDNADLQAAVSILKGYPRRKAKTPKFASVSDFMEALASGGLPEHR